MVKGERMNLNSGGEDSNNDSEASKETAKSNNFNQEQRELVDGKDMSFKEANPPRIVKITSLTTIFLSALIGLVSLVLGFYLLTNLEDSILAIFSLSFGILSFIGAIVCFGLFRNSVKVYKGSRKGLKILERYTTALLILSCLPPTPVALIFGVLLYLIKRSEFKSYCIN